MPWGSDSGAWRHQADHFIKLQEIKLDLYQQQSDGTIGLISQDRAASDLRDLAAGTYFVTRDQLSAQ